jgi:hypothetical protein
MIATRKGASCPPAIAGPVPSDATAISRESARARYLLVAVGAPAPMKDKVVHTS